MKEYPQYVTDLAQEDADLAAQVASWHGLDAVLNWMQSNPGAVDLVPMDEFESDFLIELAGNRWLAFGIT